MDDCPECKHSWHGLSCTATVRTELGTDYRIKLTEKCKCKTSFVDNTETKAFPHKKGYW